MDKPQLWVDEWMSGWVGVWLMQAKTAVIQLGRKTFYEETFGSEIFQTDVVGQRLALVIFWGLPSRKMK